MKQLVEFTLDQGGSVVVEVSEPSGGPVMRGIGSNHADLVVKANETFEGATAAVTPAARSLIAQFRAISDPPDEIALEFGVQLSAQTGAFIASIAAEASAWPRGRAAVGRGTWLGTEPRGRAPRRAGGALWLAGASLPQGSAAALDAQRAWPGGARTATAGQAPLLGEMSVEVGGHARSFRSVWGDAGMDRFACRKNALGDLDVGTA